MNIFETLFAFLLRKTLPEFLSEVFKIIFSLITYVIIEAHSFNLDALFVLHCSYMWIY